VLANAGQSTPQTTIDDTPLVVNVFWFFFSKKNPSFLVVPFCSFDAFCIEFATDFAPLRPLNIFNDFTCATRRNAIKGDSCFDGSLRMRLRPVVVVSVTAFVGLLISPSGALAALPVQLAAYYLDGLDSQTVFIAAALVLPALYLMARVVFRSVRYHFGARTQDKAFDPRVGVVVGGLIAVWMLIRLYAVGGMYMHHLGW
jgi:hypothetical protein